jgi:pyridoxal 5'-phosphate synthase pdxS subunit
VKSGLAEMLKGGVIMDVTTADQAKIAEDAGAVAVMALERVARDIRAEGGVARMADATKVEEIIEAVTIPVMAKARIGHFVEAQVLQALGCRLHRRERSPHARRRGAPHRQVGVHGAVRLRRAQPRRGAPRIAEGAGHDQDEGEAGTGQRGGGRPPPAHDAGEMSG